VLFGAGVELTRTLAALRVGQTMPVAADEAEARLLLDRWPEIVMRTLDLDRDVSAVRRARLFVAATCPIGIWTPSATTP
jgi:hypothetical protein